MRVRDLGSKVWIRVLGFRICGLGLEFKGWDLGFWVFATGIFGFTV